MFKWKPLGINRLGKIMDTSNRDGADPKPDPKPDLSTKPVDKVGYVFGYVCSKKHVNDTFDSITVEGYNIRKPCQTCGLLARPAIIKKTSEARWVHASYWSFYYTYLSRDPAIGWTKYEFVRFLTTNGEQSTSKTISSDPDDTQQWPYGSAQASFWG